MKDLLTKYQNKEGIALGYLGRAIHHQNAWWLCDLYSYDFQTGPAPAPEESQERVVIHEKGDVRNAYRLICNKLDLNKIRRRVEDRLRKSRDPEQLLKIAKILDVKLY